jgi:hypothetical protein
MIISLKELPQRLLQAGDIVVDPAKMADMPEPIAAVNPVADHALTSVTVDLLGTGSRRQGIEVLLSSLVINRDVLETMPDVLVRQGDDLGLSRFVHLGDRLEQGCGSHGHSLMTNSFPPGTKFVTETLTASVPVIMVPPGWAICLAIDPVADDRLGRQEGFPDLLIDFVAREETPQVCRLERNELIGHVFEHSLSVEEVDEVPGIVRVSVEVEWQDLGRVEADWVVE